MLPCVPVIRTSANGAEISSEAATGTVSSKSTIAMPVLECAVMDSSPPSSSYSMVSSEPWSASTRT